MKIDNYNLKYSPKTTLVGTEEVDVNLVLSSNTTVINGYIKGTVKDKNGNPIPNATVKIFDQYFTPFMHTITNPDGTYQILNVPTGNYKINASANGYLYGVSSQVYVTTNTETIRNFELENDITYNTNTLAGLLYVEGTKTPIGGATIIVYDQSGNTVATTFTADDGEFLVTELADGTYRVSPVKSGYDSVVVSTFTVASGAIYNVVLTMISVAVPTNGTYTGQILDGNNNPINGAIVGLYKVTDSGETLVQLIKTNAEGRYMFGNVPSGDYVVKAKSSNTVSVQSTTTSTQSTTTDSTSTVSMTTPE